MLVDLVKRRVLVLVGETLLDKNDRYYFFSSSFFHSLCCQPQPQCQEKPAAAGGKAWTVGRIFENMGTLLHCVGHNGVGFVRTDVIRRNFLVPTTERFSRTDLI